jgi:hypothetical protein
MYIHIHDDDDDDEVYFIELGLQKSTSIRTSQNGISTK